MRVLILGASGMLGHKLCQLYRDRYDTWATVRSHAHELYRRGILDQERILEGVEATSFDSVVRACADVRPHAVINCIGIIKQLREAKDTIVSLTVNSLFPHRLSVLCQAVGARLIHFSTDCVFSGHKGRYTEDDPSDAEDLYGRTKFLGEIDGKLCLTLRTSIIGRELKNKVGLAEWFMSHRGDTVHGYRRAIYTGFTTIALSRIISEILDNHPQLTGVYQVASTPITKYDLLRTINETYGLGTRILPDEDFRCDRSLDSTRFSAATGFSPPAWDEMIDEMYADSTPYDEWAGEQRPRLAA